jgi:hypothetical protein
MNQTSFRARQVCVLGSAEPGSSAYEMAGAAGELLVCLAWLHHRPLLPLTGCGGWSDGLERNPPDERGNSRILSWNSLGALRTNLQELGLLGEAAR